MTKLILILLFIPNLVFACNWNDSIKRDFKRLNKQVKMESPNLIITKQVSSEWQEITKNPFTRGIYEIETRRIYIYEKPIFWESCKSKKSSVIRTLRHEYGHYICSRDKDYSEACAEKIRKTL